MKKYYLKGTSKEVKMFEVVNLNVQVSETTLSYLKDLGVIEEKEVPITLDDVIYHLGERTIGTNYTSFLVKYLEEVNIKAALILLLKEIAIMLDEKYEGHIKYSKELWGINQNTYKVFKVAEILADGIPHNTKFKKCALFRTKEDAEQAITILKPILDKLNG